MPSLQQVDGGLEVIGRLFTANEGFRGQIRDDQMAQCIKEVRIPIAAIKATECETKAAL